jgi:hypothetical protein
MPAYSEHVKKARELHKTLGESEFRRRYEGDRKSTRLNSSHN